MGLKPGILNAKVMHRRLTPRENFFNYDVYYVALALSRLPECEQGRFFSINRKGLFSFYDRDRGGHDGSRSYDWAKKILADHALTQADGEVVLVTMPRILGYAFNPVSFWLCEDKGGDLRAVIAEVNNTFRETHIYLCAHEDGRIILKKDWLRAGKLFHVSPFLAREGFYRFRFRAEDAQFLAIIDYYQPDGAKQLATSLIGTTTPLTRKSLIAAFLRIPFVTLKTIALIHWQAVRLMLKKIVYINKPPQKDVRMNRTKGE